MNQESKITVLALGFVLALFGTACQPTGNSNSEPGQATPSPSASPTATPAAVSGISVTLPVLDAFFTSDEKFPSELKTKLSLTDDQVTQLRAVAREETAKLRESEAGDHSGTTTAARELSENRVKEIVGADKGSELAAFVNERWRTGGDDPDAKNAKSPAAETVAAAPNAVPTDTRIVVNTPAYRMDVFKGGQLVKSYKIGIGYPEFPLPTGLRTAKAIIFNPTWTPPDEPWVESPSSKVKVGEKIEAGSKLNPLGLLKIPIGSPSLIHGGKSPAKLGNFASHGCVGLTDALAQDFAKVLAQLAGKPLSDADIAGYKKNRSETKQITLAEPVPVELRYETIVAEDGKLHIYRDVYDRNSNTEDILRAVLEANGVKLEDLTEAERSQVLEALEEMSLDAKGKPDAVASAKTSASPTASPVASKKATPTSGRVTRSFKGKKEIVIEVAALKGKGYPVMAASGGVTPKAKT